MEKEDHHMDGLRVNQFLFSKATDGELGWFEINAEVGSGATRGNYETIVITWQGHNSKTG